MFQQVAGPSSSQDKTQKNLEVLAVVIPAHVFPTLFFDTTENN